MTRHTLQLVKPIERMVLSGHPWVYREAVAAAPPAPGTEVVVVDRRGRTLAMGLSEGGPIAARLFTTQAKARFGPDLVRERIAQALALRRAIVPAQTDAYRLLHGEGDRLPGVVCDRYADWAVVKLDGEAAWAHRALWGELLSEALPALGIRGALLRTSRRLRAGVGTRRDTGRRGGEEQDEALLFGETPPAEVVEVRECGMRLLADLYHGQKTGLFLDHRETRARVRSLADGKRVLNLYGYTGGFSVAAGLGGAEHVTTVDVAKPAIALAERTFIHNDLPGTRHLGCAQDVPEFLQAQQQERQHYDLVVADPPNFAPNVRSAEAAMASYVRLHEACCQLVNSGGYYVAASCSSHIRMTDFLQSVRAGAQRARRVLTILEQCGAPADYPRLLAFPEGDYLKVLVCRVERS